MNQLIENIIEYANSEDPVPGLSLSIQNSAGSQMFSWGHFSDQDSSIVDSTTLYDLASITKLYTSYVIIDLHNSGGLNIEDSCSKYLSVFRDSEIRIIDLLTHNANFNVRLQSYRDKYSENFKEAIFSIQPPKKASNEVCYENITYLFLGKIIEVITQKKLSVVFEELFSELGLYETHLGVLNQTNFISPPTENNNGLIIQNVTHDETARILGGVAGNAGVFSTANDLLKFSRSWLSSDHHKRLAFRNYNTSGTLPQGLGWWNRVQHIKTSASCIFSHTGYTGGIVLVDVSTSSICTLLTNRTYFGRENKKHHKLWLFLFNYLTDCK